MQAVSAVPAPVPGGDIIASEPVGPPMVTSAPAPVTVLREAVNIQFGHITHTSVRVTFNQDRSIPGTKNIMEICEYTLFALRGSVRTQLECLVV